MEQSKQVSQVSQPDPNNPANLPVDASSQGREVQPSSQRQRTGAAVTLMGWGQRCRASVRDQRMPIQNSRLQA